MFRKMFKKAVVSTMLVGASISAPLAQAEDTINFRVQTHWGPETLSGQLASEFADDVKTMSNGRLNLDMFYSSSVVKSVETFDATANGILDGDMTGGAYQVGKNAGFQLLSDMMGGYETPYQMYAWLESGGRELANELLYHNYNMHLIGWWIPGQEALASSKPLATTADLKGFKFRSPPGMETDIFAELGAKPVVMDFAEIFTGLETGIIDGADASSLANNKGLGLYDIVKHATYPGFHAMPADHFAINLEKWNALPPDLQRVIESAMLKLSLKTSSLMEVKDAQAARDLKASGVALHDWSQEDRAAFRNVAKQAWEKVASRSPEARKVLDSHTAFMKKIGLLSQ